MINKELAKQIFIDGQIIGARQMLNTVQGKAEPEVSFEEYWETISDLNETAENIEDEIFRLIDRAISK